MIRSWGLGDTLLVIFCVLALVTIIGHAKGYAAAPTIGQFAGPSTGIIYAGESSSLSVEVQDTDGPLTITTLTGCGFILGGETVTFVISNIGSGSISISESSDANNRVSGLGVSKEQINSTSWKLTVTATIHYNATDDASVDSPTCTVSDNMGGTDARSKSGWFTFKSNVEVETVTVNDSRVNLGDTVTFTVTGEYSGTSKALVGASGIITAKIKDSSVVDRGSTTIWSGGTATISFALPNAVQPNSYTAYLTPNNQQEKTISVVGDRVIVSSATASDSRVNVNDQVNVDFTLLFEYDSTAVTTGAVLVNGTASANQGSGVWRVTVSQGSVIRLVYGVTSASGNTHGITALNHAASRPAVIWDRVKVVAGSASDPRVNINDRVNVDFTLQYEYDNTNLADGTVNINGSAASYQGSGVWRIEASQTSVIRKVYEVSSVSGNTHGITNLNHVASKPSIVWDRVNVLNGGATDTRIDVGRASTVFFEVTYEYDNAQVTDGSVVIQGRSASYNSLRKRWEVSATESTVVEKGFKLDIVTGNTYGITVFRDSAGEVRVAWDRILVDSAGTEKPRISVGKETTVYFVLKYELDKGSVISGTVSIGNVPAQYSTSAKRWEAKVSETTVTSRKLTITSISDGLYQLTTITPQPSVAEVIWDKVSVTLENKKSRVDIGSTAIIDTKGIYQFDSKVWNGKVTLNNSLSQSMVGKYGYRVTSITDPQFGIDTFTSNTVDVIFDTVRVSIDLKDKRINVGENASMFIEARYQYDNKPLKGTVFLNHTTFRHNEVGVKGYKAVGFIDEQYALTTLSSEQVTLIFDEVDVEISVSDSRIDVGTNASVFAAGKYRYDGKRYDGQIILNATDFTSKEVTRKGFTPALLRGDSEGITKIGKSDIDYVIWDRVKINLVPEKSRIDIRTAANISKKAVYEFDGATLQGTIALNDTLRKDEVGRRFYTVASVNDTKYGLKAIISNTLPVIYDKVKITLSAGTDRVEIGGNASIFASGRYDYDKTEYVGTVKLNDTSSKNVGGAFVYKVQEIFDMQYGLKFFETNIVELIFDSIEASYRFQSLVPGLVRATVALRFHSDLREVENAVVTINNVKAGYNGNGEYETFINTFNPVDQFQLNIQRAGFSEHVAQETVFATGNSALGVVIVVAVAILYFALGGGKLLKPRTPRNKP